MHSQARSSCRPHSISQHPELLSHLPPRPRCPFNSLTLTIGTGLLANLFTGRVKDKSHNIAKTLYNTKLVASNVGKRHQAVLVGMKGPVERLCSHVAPRTQRWCGWSVDWAPLPALLPLVSVTFSRSHGISGLQFSLWICLVCSLLSPKAP